MTITFNQAKNLKLGECVHHVTLKNADGTPQRFRVTGKVKTWKRDTIRLEIPFKRGLNQTGHIVNGKRGSNIHTWLTLNDINLGSGLD